MSSSTKAWSDEALVRAMLGGDPAAWRVFARRYDDVIQISIDRVLRSFPALRTPTERDEIRAALLCSMVQRDMHKLRVFEFERGIKLSTWIAVLATNVARDYVRGALRRARTTKETEQLEYVDEDAPNPLAELLQREALVRAGTTIERLPERDRQLVRLMVLEGQGPAEIAAEMNISIKTVYTKKHKLMTRLQRVLEV